MLQLKWAWRNRSKQWWYCRSREAIHHVRHSGSGDSAIRVAARCLLRVRRWIAARSLSLGGRCEDKVGEGVHVGDCNSGECRSEEEDRRLKKLLYELLKGTSSVVLPAALYKQCDHNEDEDNVHDEADDDENQTRIHAAGPFGSLRLPYSKAIHLSAAILGLKQ